MFGEGRHVIGSVVLKVKTAENINGDETLAVVSPPRHKVSHLSSSGGGRRYLPIIWEAPDSCCTEDVPQYCIHGREAP